jgi:hypothetical protein
VTYFLLLLHYLLFGVLVIVSLLVALLGLVGDAANRSDGFDSVDGSIISDRKFDAIVDTAGLGDAVRSSDEVVLLNLWPALD